MTSQPPAVDALLRQLHTGARPRRTAHGYAWETRSGQPHRALTTQERDAITTAAFGGLVRHTSAGYVELTPHGAAWVQEHPPGGRR